MTKQELAKDPKVVAYAIIGGAIEQGFKNGIYGTEEARQIIGALDVVKANLIAPIMTVSKGEAKQVQLNQTPDNGN